MSDPLEILKLIGLKEEIVKNCMNQYKGCIRTCLACMVQMRQLLPETAFIDRQSYINFTENKLPPDNASMVNTYLDQSIYSLVNIVFKLSNINEWICWDALRQTNWDVGMAIQLLKDQYTIKYDPDTNCQTNNLKNKAHESFIVEPDGANKPAPNTVNFGFINKDIDQQVDTIRSDSANKHAPNTVNFGFINKDIDKQVDTIRSDSANKHAPNTVNFGFINKDIDKQVDTIRSDSANKHAPNTVNFGFINKDIDQQVDTIRSDSANKHAPNTVNFGFINKDIDQQVDTIRSDRVSNGDICSVSNSSDSEVNVDRVQWKKLEVGELRHHTNSFFTMPWFWEEEVEGKCTLLNRNHNFLEQYKGDYKVAVETYQKSKTEYDAGALRLRLLKWFNCTGNFQSQTPLVYYEIPKEEDEIVRVIEKDVVRMVFHPETRKKMTHFLIALYKELGQYGQAMSFVAGICSLVLNEFETAAIIRKIAKEYIPGHWASEARGFSTNAWLIESMASDILPDISSHLMGLNCWPDTYCQKLLNGIGIHVFPFSLMFDFIDIFMQEGFNLLAITHLSMLYELKDKILCIKSNHEIGKIYELMTMQLTIVPQHIQERIVYRAINTLVRDTSPLYSNYEDETFYQMVFPNAKRTIFEDLDIKRMVVYNKHLIDRLNKADKLKKMDYEPCGTCNKRRPIYWCNDCDVTLCSKCHRNNALRHLSTHNIEDY